MSLSLLWSDQRFVFNPDNDFYWHSFVQSLTITFQLRWKTFSWTPTDHFLYFQVDFNIEFLTNLDMDILPGLKDWIRNIIEDSVAKMLVFPGRIYLDFQKVCSFRYKSFNVWWNKNCCCENIGGSNSKKYEYEFQILGVRSYFFFFFRNFCFCH